MTHTHSLFIRTYDKDADRLRYCLQSIHRFCKDFSETVVVCSPRSSAVIGQVLKDYGFARLALCDDYANDYMGQQFTKLRADTFTTADYIFHIDSDCIFTEPYEPASAFEQGYPVLFHREYDFFYRSGVLMPWQHVTSRLMRRQVDFEFMALFPLVYPRKLYCDLARFFESVHGFTYEELTTRLRFPEEFSEFNLMGAFSYYSQNSERYHIHKNWGVFPAHHYVKQLAVDGQRHDRTLRDYEIEAIKSVLDER